MIESANEKTEVCQAQPSLSNLPIEMLEMIFEKLDVTSLLIARGVSTLWKCFCTSVCYKRSITLKRIYSLEQFEAFNQVFGNEIVGIPWSACRRRIPCAPHLYDCYYEFITKFGSRLKEVNLRAIDFQKYSACEFFGFIPNVSRILFQHFYKFDEIRSHSNTLNNLPLFKIKQIQFAPNDCQFKMESLSLILLEKLCKHVKRVDLELSGSLDEIAAKRLSNILFRVQDISVNMVIPYNAPFEKLICENLRVTSLKLNCFLHSCDLSNYEKIVASLSTLLKRLEIRFVDRDDNQKPFQFQTLPNLSYLTVLFDEVSFRKNVQLVSQLSNLTPNNVPVLRTMKLYFSNNRMYDCPSSVELFNNKLKFASVQFLHVFRFESLKLKLNFPNAIIQIEPMVDWYADLSIWK